jgi:hypothetical protein
MRTLEKVACLRITLGDRRNQIQFGDGFTRVDQKWKSTWRRKRCIRLKGMKAGNHIREINDEHYTTRRGNKRHSSMPSVIWIQGKNKGSTKRLFGVLSLAFEFPGHLEEGCCLRFYFRKRGEVWILPRYDCHRSFKLRTRYRKLKNNNRLPWVDDCSRENEWKEMETADRIPYILIFYLLKTIPLSRIKDIAIVFQHYLYCLQQDKNDSKGSHS